MESSQFTITEQQLNFYDRRHPVSLLLISTPAFIVALYFGYILMTTLIDYTFNATFGEWVKALPGILFVLAIFLIAISAGVYTASRVNLVVDTKLGVIGKRRDFLGLHNKGKVIGINKIEKIICRQKSVKGAIRPGEYNPSTTYYFVDILTNDDQQLPLINFKNKKEAKQLAKKITSFANLKLNDRL